MEETISTGQRPDRFLVGIVAGSLLLVVVGIAAVFLAGRAPASTVADPSSPVGVVQAYLEALRAGDADRSYGYLSRTAQATTPRDRYLERFPRHSAPGQTSQTSRLLIEPGKLEGDVAEVKVTISRFSSGGGPFSYGTYHQDVTVRLNQENGVWRIAQPTEPYQFFY